MKIAILGTGIVGRSIAAKLDELGHAVVIGTRDVASTKTKTEEDGSKTAYQTWLADHAGVDLKTFAEAATGADVIFNCTSGMVSESVLDLAGAANLKGKVLVDIANPLDFSNGFPPSLNPVNTDSLAERLQRKFPDTFIVKTLNTMTASIMVNPGLVKGDHTVFVSGNETKAKTTVKELLGQIGWRDAQILDLGDISTARGTEMLLPVWLRVWQALGTAEFNFEVRRGS